MKNEEFQLRATQILARLVVEYGYYQGLKHLEEIVRDAKRLFKDQGLDEEELVASIE